MNSNWVCDRFLTIQKTFLLLKNKDYNNQICVSIVFPQSVRLTAHITCLITDRVRLV